MGSGQMCKQIEPLAETDFCFQKTHPPVCGKDGDWRQPFGMVPKIAKKMLNKNALVGKHSLPEAR